MLTRRSRAREIALQMLYERDQNSQASRTASATFARDRLKDASLIVFALTLYDGVVAHRTEIDSRLAAAADNWRLARMAVVDRNVLRMGAFELLFTPDTPAHVAFDEAIELARRYGSANSPAFVNGVLDKLRQTAAVTA
ncbi:MAG: transcription antitermination factor NusB [Candidatus Acidiferrum sp.]